MSDHPCNPDTLSPEARYRFEERLGILAGAKEPTREQVLLAWLEAQQWELDNPPEFVP